MEAKMPGGYAGKLLRVDLSNERIWTEPWTAEMYRTYLGGVGIGAKILWEEVPPEVHWAHPDNRLVMATGPGVLVSRGERGDAGYRYNPVLLEIGERFVRSLELP